MKRYAIRRLRLGFCIHCCTVAVVGRTKTDVKTLCNFPCHSVQCRSAKTEQQRALFSLGHTYQSYYNDKQPQLVLCEKKGGSNIDSISACPFLISTCFLMHHLRSRILITIIFCCNATRAAAVKKQINNSVNPNTTSLCIYLCGPCAFFVFPLFPLESHHPRIIKAFV